MFINCPYCNALVATDPATDAPPERCPRCASQLRRPPEAVAEFVVPPLPSSVAVVAPAAEAPAAEAPAVEAPAAEVPGIEVPAVESDAPPAKKHFRYVFRAPVVAPPGLATPAAGPPVDPPRVAAAQLEANIAHAALVQQVLSDKADAHAASEAADAALREQAASRAQAFALAIAAETRAAAEAAAANAAAEAEAAKARAKAEADRLEAERTAAAESKTAEAKAPEAKEEVAPEGPHPAPADEPAATKVADGDDAQSADPLPGPAPAARATASTRPSPSFARRNAAAARASWPGWRTTTVLAALALLLVLQLVLADRDALAADPRWRPAIVALCGALGCSVPAWHEPSAITLLARDVKPHPGQPGVLRVTLSFRNDARWAQPWPALQLTLADVDGRPAGSRAFTAPEYLGGEPSQPLLAPGKVASVAMDVVEPAPRIVAFTFDFH